MRWTEIQCIWRPGANERIGHGLTAEATELAAQGWWAAVTIITATTALNNFVGSMVIPSTKVTTQTTLTMKVSSRSSVLFLPSPCRFRFSKNFFPRTISITVHSGQDKVFWPTVIQWKILLHRCFLSSNFRFPKHLRLINVRMLLDKIVWGQWEISKVRCIKCSTST